MCLPKPSACLIQVSFKGTAFLQEQNVGLIKIGCLLNRGCHYFVCVCVEVLPPSQPNGVMLSAVNLPNHTFTGQA